MLFFFCHASFTGMRKDECAYTPGGTFLKRANLVPIINGVEQTVTRDVLLRMCNGSYLAGAR